MPGYNLKPGKTQSQDSRGRESLAQYILRSPFSQEKMTYEKQSKTVLYRSKMNPTLKRNFAVFPVLDWIAAITTHIPNKGEQLVRYYGYYSNVSFIDQPEVIKKILQHLGLWEDSHAPPDGDTVKREITFDPSYSQLI